MELSYQYNLVITGVRKLIQLRAAGAISNQQLVQTMINPLHTLKFQDQV